MSQPASHDATPMPAPHCYRHPDRETYVSCVRCGRPICPDCMRPAPVGFQCPEEFKQTAQPAGRAPREARTAFGGRAAVTRPGLVTQILVGLCVVAYILEGVPGLGSGGASNTFTNRFFLSGYAIGEQHQYYRLITAAFLHENLLHILFNMYALYLLGTQLELILGRVRYLAVFFACALGGSTLSYVVHGLNASSLGASTAIFGFFSAFYLVARRLRANTNQILVIVGINLVITFLLPNIDKFGHIGGLVTGLAMGGIFAYIPPRRAGLQALAVAGVFLVLIVAVVVRTQTLPALPLGVPTL